MNLERIAYRLVSTEKILTVGLGRIHTLSLIRLYARPLKKQEIVMTTSLPTEGIDQILLPVGMSSTFSMVCHKTINEIIDSMDSLDDYLKGKGKGLYIQLETDLTFYTADTIQSKVEIVTRDDTRMTITTTPFYSMSSKASEFMEQAIKEWIKEKSTQIIQPPLNIYKFLTDELDKARENGLDGKECPYSPDVGRNLEIEIYKRIKHLLKEDVVREYEEKHNGT